MDHAKLDAGLLAHLHRVNDPGKEQLTVFLQTSEATSEESARVLRNLGIGNVGKGAQVITATLSVEAIGMLSDQPWILSITQSKKLRLLNKKRLAGD
jgi:hypothetical protein